jgi:hypothetical protein
MHSALAFALVAALFAVASPAHAKTTVCTITVNSSDEKETFRQNLPKDRFEFVELVEKGRPDWLASSTRKGIQCDVLVVSGHFNAGETFYSDKLGTDEYLAVDELERASCSESGLFSKLKEVYLFGCESLNPDATHYASAYGESGRDRMRRIFAKVPTIYGFHSSAPVGATAGMLLGRYFASAAPGEIFTGRPSPRLLSIFSRNHMTVTSGLDSQRRRDVCQFYDQRLSTARKVDFVHSVLRRDMTEVRGYVERIEKLYEGLGERERGAPETLQAIEKVASDTASRDQYLAYTRRLNDVALRARMTSLARTLGWLPPDQYRGELVALVNDVLAAPMSFVEVDMVCSLNRDHQLDGELGRIRAARVSVSHSAALACLGSREAQGQVLKALASADDRDVQSAQAFLRHRPPPREELRATALDIARRAGNGLSVRALDTLARLHVTDREVAEELARAFSASKSLHVQRAIAEVFIRSDASALSRPELAATVRQHRLRAPGGGEDLIDVLLRKLQS